MNSGSFDDDRNSESNVGDEWPTSKSSIASVSLMSTVQCPAWSSRAVTLYPLACVLAGVAAGLLGIGGGMIKGPLLLEMGLVPQAAAATSAFMILFTSSSSTLQFFLVDALSAEHVLWYGVLGFAAALLGGLAVRYATQREGGNAFIVFAIALVLAVSTVLMMFVGLREHLPGVAHRHAHAAEQQQTAKPQSGTNQTFFQTWCLAM